MRQITIIAKDRPGLLADIAEVLASAGVNTESLDAEQIGSNAAVVMTVDKYDEALRALANTPFRAVTEDVILVKINDRPGALAELARRFGDAGISLRSVRTVSRDSDQAIVAICTERTDEALDLVKDILIA